MKGLSKNQLHQVKEAFDLASFCKKWWKHLRKEMNKLSLSYTQKQMVLVKVAKGLLDEARDMNENDDDVTWLNMYIEENFHGQE